MSDAVTLREITDDDALYLVAWRNDPDNARWFPRQPPFTLVAHFNWYHGTYLADPSQNLYIVQRDGAPIGTVGMTIRNGIGELERVMLGDKTLARGGFMRQGIQRLMDAYGLGCYWLRVLPDNEAAISLYRKLGFSYVRDDEQFTYMERKTQ